MKSWVRLDTPFPSTGGEDDLPDLPEPDVQFMTSGTKPKDFTEAGIQGVVMNPVYAGIGELPPLASVKQWGAAFRRVIEQGSPERFLVNLLFLLRSTLGFPKGEN